jgi:hypothetical protein
MDEVMLTHADDDPKGRRPGGFSLTPQGVLHGANEALRAAFQAARTPRNAPHPHRHRRRHLPAAQCLAGIRE